MNTETKTAIENAIRDYYLANLAFPAAIVTDLDIQIHPDIEVNRAEFAILEIVEAKANGAAEDRIRKHRIEFLKWNSPRSATVGIDKESAMRRKALGEFKPVNPFALTVDFSL